jgi:hypothetical protein
MYDMLCSKEQHELQNEFTTWISNLTFKQFQTISDSLYYKQSPINPINWIYEEKQRLIDHTEEKGTFIHKQTTEQFLANIGSNFINSFYKPDFIVIETKDIEVIKFILDKSKSDIDEQVIEDYLDEQIEKSEKNEILRTWIDKQKKLDESIKEYRKDNKKCDGMCWKSPPRFELCDECMP